MEDYFYLIATPSGVKRLTKTKPSLDSDEIMVGVHITIPKRLFRPQLELELDLIKEEQEERKTKKELTDIMSRFLEMMLLKEVGQRCVDCVFFDEGKCIHSERSEFKFSEDYDPEAYWKCEYFKKEDDKKK
jgi:hypothetical protein